MEVIVVIAIVYNAPLLRYVLGASRNPQAQIFSRASTVKKPCSHARNREVKMAALSKHYSNQS
jgi:hypothetical protein